MKPFQHQLKFQRIKCFNKLGYTLIEMLIVLAIVGTVWTVVSLQPSTQFQQELEERIFFEQVRSAMNYAQEMALIQDENIEVQFNEAVNVVDEVGNIMTQVSLPAMWQVDTPFQFKYLANGHVNYFRTIELSNKQTGKVRHIVMQLGSGKFEIK